MARRKKRRKVKLSLAEKLAKKIKQDHFRDVRAIFDATGFSRITAATNKEFTYQGTTCDFDEVFLQDNILVLVELTTLKEGISEHLKKKKILYDKVLNDTTSFINFLDATFPAVREAQGKNFRPEHYRIVIVYASLNPVDRTWKADVPNVKYMDFHIVKYFKTVTGQIKRSARFELFNFLGLKRDEIGKSALSSAAGSGETYKGSILPESQSHFLPGYKVVSFYVDPEALLERCYVLRKDGWVEESNLYQRMIQKKKIESIRSYLRKEKRVFINNIIVTLPSSTRLKKPSGEVDKFSSIKKTEPVGIELPAEYNSIGLIDGQHRVFSYYEGGQHEAEISVLRTQQNLLVTGIIYPNNISSLEKTKFEATLFLEINATQTNPRSDLKQAVGLLLKPFSPDSVARRIVNRLNEFGALSNQFERYFFDKLKLKTTSVVSYGVRPIAKLQGTDSLYHAWAEPRKEALTKENDSDLLETYVDFCAKEINLFISAVKANIPNARWTADKKIPGRMLTTTHINGFIVCLRRIIENDKLHNFEYYKTKLKELHTFQFTKYRSSQYGAMGDALYEKFFARKNSRY
jgi:DGQHR domain-containing protein